MSLKKGTPLVAALLIAALALVAGLVKWAAEPGTVSRQQHQRQMTDRELQQRFQQAVLMLHAKRYDDAITALHRVLELAPRMPEAHVNMGYALIGLERYEAARSFFDAAIALNPRQANAYYGLALVDEARGDLEAALGDMRTFLHFSEASEAHRAKARSAIWEWEERLGRHKAAAAADTPAPPSRQ